MPSNIIHGKHCILLAVSGCLLRWVRKNIKCCVCLADARTGLACSISASHLSCTLCSNRPRKSLTHTYIGSISCSNKKSLVWFMHNLGVHIFPPSSPPFLVVRCYWVWLSILVSRGHAPRKRETHVCAFFCLTRWLALAGAGWRWLALAGARRSALFFLARTSHQ